MPSFVYTEDRDLNTGHGWRDYPHVLRVEDEDGSIVARLTQEPGEPEGEGISEWGKWFAEYSYAWITTTESFEKTGYAAADELRTSSIRDVVPSFRGVSDMEGHFEFHMSPKEMRTHLDNLGFQRNTESGK